MVVPLRDAGRPHKRARRSIRTPDDVHDFFSFPEIQQPSSSEPFRDAVRTFLSSHARLTFPSSSLFSSLVTWQIQLRLGDLTAGGCLYRSPVSVSLDVVEEDVTKSSRSVYCDHCRVVGWSSHPVCRKRYHFIIRLSDSNSLNRLQKHCSRCGNTGIVTDSGCQWCNSGIAVDDVEEWVYSQLEDHTHLLHGVVHSNGYGHLLNVNGKEGGSNYLSGRNIMDFWDKICTRLSVRMVSVMDVSRKYGMEYRLLHAVTKGYSWYGNWGYEFRSGSYALTQDSYRNAVGTLSSMPLNSFLFQERKPRTRLQNTIVFYQSLSDSELLTVKDLFSFLLSLIDEGHRHRLSKTSEESNSTSTVLCAWTRREVEDIQQGLIKVLAAVNRQANWITRRALKGAMYRSASPELLDYSLKHLQGVSTDGKVVLSRCNPSSNDFEYRLEPSSSAPPGCGSNADYPSEEHMTNDLRYLFDALLNPQNMVNLITQTTRDRLKDAGAKILDCKHFIKEYKPKNVNSFKINLWCHLELSDKSKENPTPPAELLVLPITATLADLKNEATIAFQEVYAMFKRLEVDELLEYGSVGESISVTLLIGTSGSVRTKGRCSTKHGLLRYRMERGTENWEVDCICGTKDDDGERMLACDACGVWHHTRCAGIKDSDALPCKFLCFRCTSSTSKTTNQSDSKDEDHQLSKAGLNCRGETGPVGSHRLNLLCL